LTISLPAKTWAPRPFHKPQSNGRPPATALLAGKAFGVAFMAPLGPPGSPLQAIQPFNVLMLCLVPGLIAALLLACLVRFTRRPQPIFLTIAGAFLLLSLIPD